MQVKSYYNFLLSCQRLRSPQMGVKVRYLPLSNKRAKGSIASLSLGVPMCLVGTP